jgi:hypothetical protein
MNITQIYNPNYKDNIQVDFNSKINIYELNTIPNGSIDNIYCDIFDTIEFSKRIDLQNELMKKVRVGGLVHLKQINILLLSKKIIKGDIDLAEINNIFQNATSSLDQQYMDHWVSQQSNFFIEKIDIDGIYTLIVMKRVQ